jgi:desulfoferrodoxin (superoxide reductase-like protein)
MDSTEEYNLKRMITDICFESGGVTKPMVDKLYILWIEQMALREQQVALNTIANLKVDFMDHVLTAPVGELLRATEFMDRAMLKVASKPSQRNTLVKNKENQ